MSPKDKADLMRDLRFHLDHYRDCRNSIIHQVSRGKPILQNADHYIGFHALRLAEILDRLDGRTQ